MLLGANAQGIVRKTKISLWHRWFMELKFTVFLVNHYWHLISNWMYNASFRSTGVADVDCILNHSVCLPEGRSKTSTYSILIFYFFIHNQTFYTDMYAMCFLALSSHCCCLSVCLSVRLYLMGWKSKTSMESLFMSVYIIMDFPLRHILPFLFFPV